MKKPIAETQLFSRVASPSLYHSTVELSSHIFFCFFKDVNECAEGKDDCNHLCTNTIGSYNCMCRDGYYLHQDGRTCVGKIFLNH